MRELLSQSSFLVSRMLESDNPLVIHSTLLLLVVVMVVFDRGFNGDRNNWVGPLFHSGHRKVFQRTENSTLPLLSLAFHSHLTSKTQPCSSWSQSMGNWWRNSKDCERSWFKGLCFLWVPALPFTIRITLCNYLNQFPCLKKRWEK